MKINTTERDMTVDCYVAICYEDEYIVELYSDFYADYFENSWYEEDYGSRCYEQFINNDIRFEIADEIYSEVMSNIERDDCVNDTKLQKILYDKILEQIDAWDFYRDTEVLYINIDFNYDKQANIMKERTVSIKGLRRTHFEQMYQYLINFEREECYYGNKEQYFKRHRKIKEWLENIINNFDNNKGE